MDEQKDIGEKFEGEMETRYMPDAEFITFVRSLPWSRKALVSADGHMRWKIKGDDDKEYFLRPESAQ